MNFEVLALQHLTYSKSFFGDRITCCKIAHFWLRQVTFSPSNAANSPTNPADNATTFFLIRRSLSTASSLFEYTCILMFYKIKPLFYHW
ncbi:hypothetical protein [Nostoc sp. T09]|uniref:hypothetical protein n=1 Tax=Nostoc sp. T09 TaxID=1932621 RepID=UPI001180E67C|nr:hypothetical protein [Nostoc sp. T09]